MPVSENAVHYLEIVSPDAEALRDAYAEAYRWQFQPADPDLGNAFVADLPDGSMCGIRPPMSEQEQPIVRTYLRVHDVEAATREAARLGATVLLEAMTLGGHGTISIYELGGIQQGLWQLP